MAKSKVFIFPPIELSEKLKRDLKENRDVVAAGIELAEKTSDDLSKWRREHEQLGEEIQELQRLEKIDELNRAITKRGLLKNKIENAERGQHQSLSDETVAALHELGQSIAAYGKGYAGEVEDRFAEILAPLYVGKPGTPEGWARETVRATPVFWSLSNAAINSARMWGRGLSGNFTDAGSARASAVAKARGGIEAHALNQRKELLELYSKLATLPSRSDPPSTTPPE